MLPPGTRDVNVRPKRQGMKDPKRVPNGKEMLRGSLINFFSVLHTFVKSIDNLYASIAILT